MMRLTRFFKRNRCPHVVRYGLYGDVVNAVGGYRLFCPSCKTFLEGPVELSTQMFPYPYMNKSEKALFEEHMES